MYLKPRYTAQLNKKFNPLAQLTFVRRDEKQEFTKTNLRKSRTFGINSSYVKQLDFQISTNGRTFVEKKTHCERTSQNHV